MSTLHLPVIEVYISGIHTDIHMCQPPHLLGKYDYSPVIYSGVFYIGREVPASSYLRFDNLPRGLIPYPALLLF